MKLNLHCVLNKVVHCLMFGGQSCEEDRLRGVTLFGFSALSKISVPVYGTYVPYRTSSTHCQINTQEILANSHRNNASKDEASVCMRNKLSKTPIISIVLLSS